LLSQICLSLAAPCNSGEDHGESNAEAASAATAESPDEQVCQSPVQMAVQVAGELSNQVLHQDAGQATGQASLQAQVQVLDVPEISDQDCSEIHLQVRTCISADIPTQAPDDFPEVVSLYYSKVNFKKEVRNFYYEFID
jgi:hypothetical protein